MNDSPDHERGDAELSWEDVELGPIVRQDRYAKVHSVLASSWDMEEWEAHVFEIRTKEHARFLEFLVWPKMKKSSYYKTDFTRDSTHIFIRHMTQATEPTEVNRTKTKRQHTVPPGMAAAIPDARTQDEVASHLAPGAASLDPVGLVKHGFEKTWEEVRRTASDFIVKQPNGGTGDVKDFDKNIPLAAPDERRRPGRASARPLPHDRDLRMILDLARAIEEEEDQHIPGRSFFLEHLYPPTEQPEGSTLEELASNQQARTDRLTRLIKRIPKVLKELTKQRAATWEASMPRILQVFGIIEKSEDHKEDLDEWSHFLRWIHAYSFEGFDADAMQRVAHALSAGYVPVMAAWFSRIQSHSIMHQWTDLLLTKGFDEYDAPDPILMQMLHAHTKRELVIGMQPVLERMRWVSELTTKYWKAQTACSEFKAMLSQDIGGESLRVGFYVELLFQSVS
ncbi:hypothetical protein PG997_014365 [Apiospora hydei]|uniref:Uncharacterized protein n=1 Tax=Apiospora hydei TaxID=1337664 RepID=A0ABR1UWT3_9PEZI